MIPPLLRSTLAVDPTSVGSSEERDRRGDVGGLAQPLQRSELRQVVDHLFRLANEEQLRCRRSRSDRIDGDVAATEFFGEHCVMASTAAFVAA